jgi:hypothetical protein
VELPIAVLGFGVLLLLVGLVGGDLSHRSSGVPVGPLPRSATTLAGVALVVLSLVVGAVADSVPGDTATSGTTVAGASLPDEPAPIGPAPAHPVPVEAVRIEPAPVEQVRVEPEPRASIVVSVVEHLAAGQATEQVELSVDGAHVGVLRLDQDEPTAVLEIPLDGPGPVAYDVAAEGLTVLGQTWSAHGAATVDVEDGSTLHVDLDLPSGAAVLVHGPPVA